MQGQGSPETSTHGSATVRQQWLQTGFRTGKPSACTTVAKNALS